jgi:ferredoxin
MNPTQNTMRTATRFIRIDTRTCTACWNCIAACKQGAIGKINLFFHKHSRIVHADLCTGCLKCMRVCESHAITHIPKPKEALHGRT